MPNVDHTVPNADWAEIASGVTGALIQLKSHNKVHVAAAATKPDESSTVGFELAHNGITAMDVDLSEGDKLYAKSASGTAKLTVLGRS